MKNKELKKRLYIAPKIDIIKIDKNISMVMMSGTPPGDPPILPGGSIFK